MSSRLEKLLMRVELIDKVTAPANKISASIKNIHKTAEAGFMGIGKGVAGIFGAGLAFNSLTAGAREMKAALADVKSLGVAGDALAKLEKRAIAFSIAYGESAVEFIRSSYDIWGALPGLAGDELASFTEAGGLLAKATKADANMVSEFMGTMYNIFEKQANKIGRATWVEMMAGQIAKAVDIFKTSGKGMSEAFTNLGASAISRPMEEQVAVLGKLQAVMKGANAGTAYKSFVMGISKAEKELGVALTDSQGNMLGVVEILRKIQGRVNGMGDAKVNAMLSKAFGEPAVAMISNLIGHIDSLEGDIATIGATPGMDDLKWMVEQMVDPYQQMTQANTALRLSFGKLINWALEPFYVVATKHQQTLAQWIDKYPHLFGAIAKLTIFVMSFTAIIGLLAIAKGTVIIAAAGLSAGLTILRVVMLPFGPLLKALRYAWLMFNLQLAAGAGLLPALRVAMAAFTKSILIHTGALRVARMATWAWGAALGFTRAAVLATAISFGGMRAGLVAMRAGFIAGATGAWAFTAALLANPITWIVVGVAALIAGLVLLVTHWDTVKGAVGGAISYIVEKWKAFRSAIESTTVLKYLFTPLFATVDLATSLFSILARIPAVLVAIKDFFVVIGQTIYLGAVFAIQMFMEKLTIVQGILMAVGSVFSQVFTAAIDWVSQRWSAFTNMLADSVLVTALMMPFTLAIGAVDLLLTTLEKIPQWFTHFKNWLADLNPFDILKGLDSVLVAGLNLIPGVNIGGAETTPVAANQPVGVPDAVQNISSLPTAAQGVAPVTAAAIPTAMNLPAAVQKIESVSAPVIAPTLAAIPQPIEPVLLPFTGEFSSPIKMPVEATLTKAIDLPKAAQPVNVPASIARAEAANDVMEREREALKPAPAAPIKNVPAGGLQQQFNSANNNRSTHIGSLNVNTTLPVNGYSLQDQLLMAGG